MGRYLVCFGFLVFVIHSDFGFLVSGFTALQAAETVMHPEPPMGDGGYGVVSNPVGGFRRCLGTGVWGREFWSFETAVGSDGYGKERRPRLLFVGIGRISRRRYWRINARLGRND
jgi:hypothetical protein